MKISTTDGRAAQAELSRGTVNSLLLVQAEVTVAPVTHLTFSEKLPSEVLCAWAVVAVFPFRGWGDIRDQPGCSRKQGREELRC